MIRTDSFQRSQNVFALPELERVHRAALVDRPLVERDGNTRDVGGPLPQRAPAVALGSTDGIPCDLVNALGQRGTSWGKMRRHPPLKFHDVSRLCHFALTECYDRGDEQQDSDRAGASLTRLILVANRVDGLEAGIYSLCAQHRELLLHRRGTYAREFQGCYRLPNYNLEQVALIVVLVSQVAAAFERFGERGLRILNAQVGMLAQNLYIGASGLGIGCGAALGFRNDSANELLGLDEQLETSQLLIFLGNQVPQLRAAEWGLL